MAMSRGLFDNLYLDRVLVHSPPVSSSARSVPVEAKIATLYSLLEYVDMQKD